MCLSKKNYSIERIRSDEALYPFIMEIHYAKRKPSISYAFGLFDNKKNMVGIVTFGTPASSTLRRGIAGKEHEGNILELNRLVLLHNKKNEASMLVSGSIKQLPKNKIIVSFADTEQNHLGIVYQASNFRYYGLSAKRTDWKVRGMEHLHGITIADKMRPKKSNNNQLSMMQQDTKSRSELMREKYGDDFYLKERPRKHRYIYCRNNSTYDSILYRQEAFPRKPHKEVE